MAALKSKAAVLAALALTVGGATSAVVHHAFARTAAPVVLAAAEAPAPAAKEPSWRKRFNEVYHLDEGQILRRVPPPFIPERAAYFQEADSTGTMFDPIEDSMTVFHWDGNQATLNMWARGQSDVQRVMGMVLGIPSYKIDMALKDRLRPMPGDWVMRADESEEKKVGAFASILRQELKWNVHFEKREAEREVILATGTFTAPKEMIDVYVDARDGNGANGGDVASFLRNLGERANIEFIDQTQSSKAGAFWRNHAGENLSRADIDKLLAHVTEQTGLHFQRAKRVTSHWVAIVDPRPVR